MRKLLAYLPIALVGAFVLTACSSGVSELTSKDDQKAFLESVAKDIEGEKAFTIEGNMKTSQNGIDLDFEMTVAVDDKNNSITMKMGEGSIYMTEVDGVSYMSEDGTKWYNLGAPSEDDDLFGMDDITEGIKDVETENFEYLGVADCEKAKCQKFKFVEDGETSIAYIDGKSMKLVRMEMEGADGSTGSFNVKYSADIKAPEAEKLSEEEAFGKSLELFLSFLEKAGVEFN